MLIDCRYGGRVPWDGSRQICRRTQEFAGAAKPNDFGQNQRRLCVRLTANQLRPRTLLGRRASSRGLQAFARQTFPPTRALVCCYRFFLHQGRVTLASSSLSPLPMRQPQHHD